MRLLLCLRWACLSGQTLLRRLHVLQLLAELRQPDLQFVHGVVQRLNLAGDLVARFAGGIALLLLQIRL